MGGGAVGVEEVRGLVPLFDIESAQNSLAASVPAWPVSKQHGSLSGKQSDMRKRLQKFRMRDKRDSHQATQRTWRATRESHSTCPLHCP